MTTAWILTTGEDHEGGDVLGVYADKPLAFADFLVRARQIQDTFQLDTITGTLDGDVYAHGGCDWVRLTEHVVVERHAIAGDPIAEVAALLGR